jgi:hypothetical protein
MKTHKVTIKFTAKEASTLKHLLIMQERKLEALRNSTECNAEVKAYNEAEIASLNVLRQKIHAQI